jgi:TolA-binding protein
MENIEEQILTYPHRSREEQREIEAFVEDHPEWASLLRDVRALEGFAQVRRLSEQEGPVEALLATYVTVRHVHPRGVSPALDAAFRRLEGRIEGDEGLREQAEAMRRRLVEAEAEVDPVPQFEELTGHDLSAESTSDPVSAPEQTNDASTASTSSPSLIEMFFQLSAPARWIGSTLVLLLGTYGGLYGVSVATQSPLDRLAAVDVSEQVIESYAPAEARRGPASDAEADTMRTQDRYLEALSSLRAARTAPLGLFPEYDADTVRRAEQLLRDVVAREEGGTFLALEARFYLGKAHLAQRQVEEARTQFEAVVAGEGRQADEARRILDALSDVSSDESSTGR